MRVREIYLLGAVLAAGLVACSDKTNPRVVTRLNDEAALVGELPSNPLKGKVITSWVNKHDATMSTMLGNDVAVQYARTRPSALRSLRSNPVRRELEGVEGFHENELG